MKDRRDCTFLVYWERYFTCTGKLVAAPCVILLYRITLQTSILNGISESGTPATYADMHVYILIIIIIGLFQFPT